MLDCLAAMKRNPPLQHMGAAPDVKKFLQYEQSSYMIL